MPKDVTLLADWIRGIRDDWKKAHALAAIEMGQKAELEAKKNIIKQFTGRGGYRLTGRLLNSVFWAIDKKGKKGFPRIFLGTKGIPYGAIHEYGGDITPKKAQNLWVKNYRAPKQFYRMTPKEFMNAKRNSPGQYLILNQTAFYRDTQSKVGLRRSALKNTSAEEFHALFFLVKQVTMPERPYLRPAVAQASKIYPRAVEKHWARLVENR